MRILIGMETSGALRRRFQALGHDAISVDLLPAEDDGIGHIVGDVFDVIADLWARDWWPDGAIFHPDCTYLTNSAAWAYADPDFDRYPGVGYHQRVSPETLVGGARREAREDAIETVRRIFRLKIRRIIAENPVGALSTRFRKPTQIVQPYQFGDDASKLTCLWFLGTDWEIMEPEGVRIDPRRRVPGRMVEWPAGSGKMVERWANQTDSNQNRLSPGEGRWKDRSRTYPGIADALVEALIAE